MAFIDDIQSRDTALFPIVEIKIPNPNIVIDSGASLSSEMPDNWTGFYTDDYSVFAIGQLIKIDDELMRITEVMSGYVVNVDREQFGTIAVTHASGSSIHIIGWHNISTKDFNLGNTHYNPLLLSTPSIKESIDLENRKYKISNVSLKISNAEYNGLRFTDSQITLNTSVLIHWVSPSCTVIDDCYLAYKGTVRAITHDEKTCNITLEDISQSSLHRDVPVTLLDTDEDNVPDKYKGKPVPMVYGAVDRSPCVLNYELEDEVTFAVNVIVDKGEIDFFKYENYGNMHYYHPLFINDGGNYINIENQFIRLGDGFDSQYTLSPVYSGEDIIAYSGKIEIPVDFTGGASGQPVNHMAYGELEGKIVRKAMVIAPINSPPYTQWDIGGDEGMVYDYVDYFHDLDKAKNPPDYGYLDPINIPALHVAGINCEVVDIGLDYYCETYVSIKVEAMRPSEAEQGSNPSNANLYIDTDNDILDISDTDVWHTFNNINQIQGAFDKKITDWDTINASNVFQMKSSTSAYSRFNISVKYHHIAIVQHCLIPAPLDKDFYVNVKGRTS